MYLFLRERLCFVVLQKDLVFDTGILKNKKNNGFCENKPFNFKNKKG